MWNSITYCYCFVRSMGGPPNSVVVIHQKQIFFACYIYLINYTRVHIIQLRFGMFVRKK